MNENISHKVKELCREKGITIKQLAEKMALLEQCNYDLQAVEMKIREHTPTNTSIRRKMEPFRILLQSIRNTETNPMNLREFIA